MEPFNGQPYEGGTHLNIGSARMLAEVAAKRRILDEYEYWAKRNSSGVPDGVDGGQEYGLEFAVRCLVLPYAEHPNYRPDWPPAS